MRGLQVAAHSLRSRLSIIDAAHVGVRGLSQKAPDREAIPLCRFHHTEGPYALHRLGKKFWIAYDLDPQELIKQLNQKYEEEVLNGNAI